MLLKDGIVDLRQKGLSLGLVRELLATINVAVSTATIARFHAEMTAVQPHHDNVSDSIASAIMFRKQPPTNCIRFNKPRTLNSLSRDADAGE